MSAPIKGRQSATPSSGKRSVLICLLRLDLRIHDNPLFHFAHTTARPLPSQANGAFNKQKAAFDQDLYSTADYLLPVFVFDEREIELSGLPDYKRKGPEARTQLYGFWKTGGFRARFISESVYDLRSRLREVGSDLFIRFGRPEDVIGNLVEAFQKQGDDVEGVWMQKEMTYQETQVEVAIEEKLRGVNVPLRYVHGKTLIHPADLPFDIADTPDVFTPFRKRVEALAPQMVRPALTSPSKFKPFPSDIPAIPDYALDVSYEVDVDGLSSQAPESKEKTEGQISFHDILRGLLRPLDDTALPYAHNGTSLLQQRHSASAFPLRGGESSALERMEWYFVRGKSVDSSRWGKADPPPVARYKQTRNNLIGHAYSTKMSPFLAYGSISPRTIWEALDAHERKFGEDQNTYWVRFELLWRDYFFFVAEKFGDLLFDLGGFERATDPRQAERKMEPGWWKLWDPVKDGPEHQLTRLLEGRTGIPFIDANILELRESGFMSNRGRQNVASFLSKDLGYDWRIGAEFFRSHLIDYDATSNYGNWQYVAGVGNDPRASRQFNCIKQAKDYDSHGDYVKMWIVALRNLPVDYVHTPWLMSAEERRLYGLKTTAIDVTMDSYPARPVIEHETWHKHYDRKEGMGSKMHGNPQEKVKDGKVKRYKKPLATRMQPAPMPPQWQPNDARGMGAGYVASSSGNYFPPARQHASSPSPHPLNRAEVGAYSATGSPKLPSDAVRRSPTPSTTPSSSSSQSAGAGVGAIPTAVPRGAPGSRFGARGLLGGVLGGAMAGAPSLQSAIGGGNGVSKADSETSWRRGIAGAANGATGSDSSTPSERSGDPSPPLPPKAS